jgi:hypothetical protein
MNYKTAGGGCLDEGLRAVSLHFLAKWSVSSRYCLSPQGEFSGCSVMSLDVQKQPGRPNTGSCRPPHKDQPADRARKGLGFPTVLGLQVEFSKFNQLTRNT